MSIVILLFSLAILVAGAGILLNKKGKETELRSITVTVVARNEERVLPHLLQSLERIDYPPDLYEIILVNDCSGDDTYRMFEDFARKQTHVQVLKIEEENKSLPGKKEGLQRALERAKHEIFLLTDADCIVDPQWLHDCSRYWDEETVMLVGYAPEEYKDLIREATFWKKILYLFRRFAQIATAGIFAATIGLGKPFSCYGRNIAIAREVLLNAGGYHTIGKERAGDDKQILNAMKRERGKIRYSPLKNVVSFPELEKYSDQQKRKYGKLKMSSTPYFLATLLVFGFFIYLPVRVFLFKDILSFLILYLSLIIAWTLNLIKHRERFVLSDLIFILIYPYYTIYYTISGSRGDWQWKS